VVVWSRLFTSKVDSHYRSPGKVRSTNGVMVGACPFSPFIISRMWLELHWNFNLVDILPAVLRQDRKRILEQSKYDDSRRFHLLIRSSFLKYISTILYRSMAVHCHVLKDSPFRI
jgi:hypothetical protein